MFGTIQTNRKHLPKEMLTKNAPLAKHEYKVAQAGELPFSVWMDTKAVCVVSNYHCPGQAGTVNRRSGHVEQQQLVVLATLADYQQNMKGVDLYRRNSGGTLAAHNAHVVAKESNEEYCRREWPRFQDFLEDLVENLVDISTSSRAPPNLLVA
ncbi:hypothetical protein RRG08_046626 [Elysia crispata]|uniref:PiggyBac transposable element-derived protein domain-containing protein n=1 Tax=Elysia crispata TaxID=231223 RepID=A0AAE1E212_9GAST|nr:hypothetical protein RRG08_046626 [Elysia crispata]